MKVLRLVMALVYAFALVVPGVSLAQEVKQNVSPATEQRVDFSLQERVPMALVVVTPTGKIGDYSSSAILNSAEPVLAANTNLKLVNLQDRSGADITGCKGRLVCYVETVRTDYQPDKAEFRREDQPELLKPWSEVRRMLESGPQKPERFLVVLSSVRTSDGSDRLSAVLIDTDAALDFVHRANERGERLDPKKQEELEDRIAQYAVRASPAPEQVSNADDIDRVLAKIFGEDFRTVFDEAGHWKPYGVLEIACAQEGMEIYVDGERAGLTRAGITRIGGMMPGDRVVRLTRPDFLPIEQHALLEKNQVIRVDMQPVREPNDGVRLSRDIVFWSGVGTTVLGAVLTGYAIAEASSAQSHVACLHSANAGGCDFKEWWKFGANSGEVGITDSITSGGLPIAPIGYSLMGAGLVWSLATLLMNDDDTAPWLEILAGVGVFAASLTISTVVADDNPVTGSGL
jgi:hypothetical protein